MSSGPGRGLQIKPIDQGGEIAMTSSEAEAG
jgi:hypothetical protein